MAIPKPPLSDANATAARLVREATGEKPVRGEDLIEDPELRKQFVAAKKRYAEELAAKKKA